MIPLLNSIGACCITEMDAQDTKKYYQHLICGYLIDFIVERLFHLNCIIDSKLGS